MPPVAKVFISYRRAPSLALALLIADRLTQHNIQVFVDVERMDSVGPFPRRLLKAIEDSDIFVCLLANTTLDAEWVQREVDHAYTMGKPMIPVFQESYVPMKEPLAHSIAVLLEHQGVPVLDIRGVLVDESIGKLARMIVETMNAGGAEPELPFEQEEIAPEPVEVVAETQDPTVQLDDTLNDHPPPPRFRWLWPLSAILIVLIGFAVFQYVNQPLTGISSAETQTAVALAGGATVSPVETEITNHTPTPAPTAAPTVAPSPTCTPNPPVASLAVGLVVRTRSEPSDADSAVIGSVANERLPITGVSPDGEFYRVRYGDQEVWIQNVSSVHVEGDLGAVPVVPVLVVGLTVRIRSEPSTADSAIIGSIINERLLITGVSPDGEFYRVRYGDQEVWIENVPSVHVEGDLTTVTLAGGC